MGLGLMGKLGCAWVDAWVGAWVVLVMVMCWGGYNRVFAMTRSRVLPFPTPPPIQVV